MEAAQQKRDRVAGWLSPAPLLSGGWRAGVRPREVAPVMATQEEHDWLVQGHGHSVVRGRKQRRGHKRPQTGSTGSGKHGLQGKKKEVKICCFEHEGWVTGNGH